MFGPEGNIPPPASNEFNKNPEEHLETQNIPIEKTAYAADYYLIPIGRPGAANHRLQEFATIGRDTSCEIVVKDTFASGRHARIEKKLGGYFIRDLQSRNGTFLNGGKIQEATLSPNDRIRFGETVFVFAEAPADTHDLQSKNAAWSDQLARLPVFAATDFPVLITGPSGSGKEILARAIHAKSTRAAGPFISINCSALSENLIESELFGHIRGSFTGASHDRKGAFESARSGTLFLDEIGDLPLSLQPKILRAIENSEIRPVGSDRSIETNVRIVAATHKNLAAKIKNGTFREDLFYRLNVCQLRPPSLSERPEDFEDLLYTFARSYRVRFSYLSIQKLKEHSWPGNVRELKNLVARASAYYPGRNIQPQDLPAVLETTPQGVTDGELHDALFSTGSGTNGSVIREIEREMIVRRLVANKGNQRQTARDLGMPKSTLHDRLKAYAIRINELPTEIIDPNA